METRGVTPPVLYASASVARAAGSPRLAPAASKPRAPRARPWRAPEPPAKEKQVVEILRGDLFEKRELRREGEPPMTPRRSSSLVLAVAALACRSRLAASALPPLRIDRSVGAASELALEAGQNRLLILSEEIGRVAVADPSVADLKVVTPNQLLLTAKSAGTTDLTLWNRNNEPLVIALAVTRNLEPLRKQVKELFPGEKVTITGAGELVDPLRRGERRPRPGAHRRGRAKLHAKQVANLVKVSGNQQVQLEVRFAEVGAVGAPPDRRQPVPQVRERRGRSAGMTGRGVPGDFLNTTEPGHARHRRRAGAPPPGMPPEIFRPQFNTASRCSSRPSPTSRSARC